MVQLTVAGDIAEAEELRAILRNAGIESDLETAVEHHPAAIEDAPRAPVDLSKYELPAHAQHSLARIGANVRGNPSFPANAFGASNGVYLTTLMQRIDAPIASRWASIALRRSSAALPLPASPSASKFTARASWISPRTV